jgi:hypothetical protein
MSTGGYRDVSSTRVEFRGSQGPTPSGAKRSLFFWVEKIKDGFVE